MALSNADMLAAARQLPIPVPWDREQLIENLAAQRGRPIRLVPTPTAALGESPCGLWLTCESEDLILHESGTTEYHIDQIVCHEIGHMVLGHGRTHQFGGDGTRLDELCRTFMPDIDPAMVHAVLGRTNFETDQERDAEMFANMMMIAAAEAAASQSMMRSVFFRPR